MVAPVSTSSGNAPPDWSSQTDELHCSLCDYNLRGLNEPQCPECGYAFEWRDLTDPQRKRHPYLFEHHPTRNVRSFVRTLLGQLLPWRFWRTLRPEMPSNRRRLMAYWLISAGFCVLWLVLPLIFIAIEEPIRVHQNKVHVRTFYTRPENQLDLQLEIRRFGSIEAYIDNQIAGPLNRRFWQYLWTRIFNEFQNLPRDWRSTAAAGLLVWPWATLLAMQVFRMSMRQARILPIHLQRTVLYSFDVTVLLFVAGVTVFAARTIRLILFGEQWRPLLYWFEPIIAALLVPLVLYRLAIAFMQYLRLKHTIESILLTQFIVLLCMAAAVARTESLLNYLVNQWLNLKIHL